MAKRKRQRRKQEGNGLLNVVFFGLLVTILIMMVGENL